MAEETDSRPAAPSTHPASATPEQPDDEHIQTPHKRTRARRPLTVWRVGTPLTVLMAGAIFAVSAERSDGTDLRGGRYTDMASVVQAESKTTGELTEQVSELTAEVEQLTAGLGDRSVQRLQEQVDALSDPAGLTPRSGPAVKVTLDDAPPEARDDPERDPLEVVVHQQDIQAVVNAMWRAGARAVTVQGQRLISTTGIKCEGNSVTLQGIPYSPPYEIVGVGTTEELLDELAGDSYVQVYREATDDPRGAVSYAEEVLPTYTAPAYDSLLDLSYAQPLT